MSSDQDRLLALSRRFMALPAGDRRRLRARMAEQGIGAGTLPVPPRDAATPAPASHAQQRLWVLWRLQPDSPAYNLAGALRLTGALDAGALQRSLDALAERHWSLRTVFSEDGASSDGSSPVLQHVRPAGPVAVERFDAEEGDLDRLLAGAIREPFDLAAGPLLRAGLYRLADDRHVLLLRMHHIVFDGWSLGLLIGEFSRLYAAFHGGRAPHLAPLPVQYADWALWQRRWSEAGEGEGQLAYWRARLGDEHPLLELPADRPRPAEASHLGASVQCRLPAAEVSALRGVAGDATLFMLLLTAFLLLLHRMTGQDDLRVGLPVAGRTRRETEGVIGLFVNTLVLRQRIDGRHSFAQLLAEVRQACLEAQENQDLPFDQLVEALAPQRSLAHHPLFQVMFNHQRLKTGALSGLPGLKAEPLALTHRVAKFDLSLDSLEAEDGSLQLGFTYARDLFDEATAEALLGRLRGLLAQLTEWPERPLEDFDILTDGERADLLGRWNATDAPLTEPALLHRRVERQVLATPDAPALVCGGETLSYAELDARAGRWADGLRALGVRPDDLVGVLAERSVAMVIGLLAVVKAGAAYVPLDPEHPADRLAYTLEDSGVRLILTQAHLRAGLPPTSARILCLDEAAPVSGAGPEGLAEADPLSLAYCIYTSGTTGRPKGAGNGHAALMNRLDWMQRAYPIGPGDRVLQKTPFGFDVSVWEFFWPLVTGATLVMAPPGAHRDPAELRRLIVGTGVTVTHFVPSMLQAFLAAEDIGACTSLRHVICSGEALPHDVQQRFLARSRAALHNLYGPTEAAIDVSAWTCRDEPGRTAVPIGLPIDNIHLHVLDAGLALVPPGVTGELYIGGIGLARGYHRRPGLTAERFVPDPFGRGGRLYRTGDLVRRRADGAIDYVGRADHQVKIRGLRIELGEIEARLLEHPAVAEAVVVAVDGRQLVGYVVAPPVEGLVEALKAHLRRHLPDYMVPAALVRLDRMPLSPNGKLDRRALPAPERDAGDARVAPAGGPERRLAALWEDLLGVQGVGATDNFFELGGDSIVSIQLVSRARQLGLHLSPKEVFQHQTLQALARVARLEESAPVPQGPVEGGFDLTPFQARFFATPMARRHHWNQSVLLTPRTTPEVEPLRRALARLVAHHDALRLRFDDGRAWHAGVEEADDPALLRVVEVAGEEAIRAVGEEAQASLDLGRGPLLRAVLMRLPDGGSRLLLVVHHLAVDGVSWRVLLEDLQRACRDQALPPKTTAFRDWTAHLHRLAHQPALLEAERGWWLEQLDGADTGLRPDRPGAEAHVRDAARVELLFGAEETRRLLQEAPAAYRTQVNDLLLTALARVLCRQSGRPDTLVELEGHGREAPEGTDLSRTVGWFTAAYPVRLTPAAGPGASLRAVKEQLRRIPGGGLGYGLLRHLVGDPALAAALEPRVTFNYLGQFDGSFADDALFGRATEDAGPSIDPDAPLDRWLSIDGGVAEGRLRLAWTYARTLFDEDTVRRLADGFRDELLGLLAHCLDPASGGLTPSDVPLARLDQDQLDRLLGLLPVPVPARGIADIHPLSPVQKGILFHSLYEPGGTAYINQLRVTVAGLDIDRFAAAWHAMADRHDSLRSGFLSSDGAAEPLQIVLRQATLAPEILDWRGRPDQDRALEALAEEERRRGFDLSAAPLMRLVLVRLDETRYRVLWTHHHILLDGWSGAQLLGEVLQHYAGEALPPAPAPFRDYIAWLLARDGEADRGFWLDRLAGLDGPVLLADSLSGEERAEGQAALLSALDGEAAQRLQRFARQQRVTVNTLVQAAWLLLLHRYTGQETVVFGATSAGRPAELPEVERRLGLFINTLPLAAAPEPRLPVGDWLQRIQALNLAAREHEHTPLGDIQRWLGSAGQALFDSVLVFENYPVAEAFRRHALDVSDLVAHEESNYPLMVEVTLGEGLQLHYRHDRSRFGDAAVRRIDRHFRRLLLAMAEDAARPLAALEMLDPSERDEILAQGLEGSLPSTLRFPQAFERQAALTPEAAAVIQGNRTVTYAELDGRADRLARRLRAAGVGPDRLVAVAMERTPALPAALLAVLKAGGAYVPLDPAFPADRLGYMLEDSGAALLLTESRLLAELPRPDGLEVWCLDGDESEEGEGGEAAGEGPEVSPDHLAYVIYTSGSTGRPKGVAVRRGALGNFLESMGREPGIGRDDRVLALTSLSFDIAALELFLPLSVGGTVVLVDRDTARDPARLWAEIGRHRVTAVQATPSTWRMLGEAGDFSALAGAKILCGGEALPAELAARLGAAGPVWNLYGPTETTVWSAVDRLDREHPQPRLGGPVARTALYLLDGALEPVPAGVTGELYIGGDGLARGYHGRPDLTAERFVPDPFAGGGGRLYRTGDLARRRADGALDYVGRADHQVKIRGFRIELGEIEARLCGHPLVRAAAVVAREGAGGTRLLGYVAAAEEGTEGLEAALKALLHEQLPDYMVPARILRLDALPLTPNRKLDRKALPAPEEAARPYAPPASEAERALAQSWREILGLDIVGLDDGFFELGGDSIVSIQVISRLRQLGWGVTPRQIFELQTVRALGAVAEPLGIRAPYRRTDKVLARLTEAQWAGLPVPADGVQDLYPLSPLQEGLLMHTLLEPGTGIYLMQNRHSVEAVIDHARFDAAWTRVVERNEALRTSFLWEGLERPLQIINREAGDWLLHYDLRGLDPAAQEGRVDAVMGEEVERGMDLARPPLFRIRLFRLGEARYQLVVSYHHIVMDAWCVFLLLSDFVMFYRALEAGTEPVLPTPPPYRDFIAWLADRDLGRTRDYWRAELRGVEAATPLPADRPLQTRQGRSSVIDRLVTLTEAEDRDLRRLATDHRLTVNTFVQAAWALLLHRYGGGRDVLFGITVAGRPLDVPELQGTLGLFINSIPLRVRLPGPEASLRVGDWLKRLLDQNVAMRDFEHLPLVEIHRLSGVPQGQPLFDSLFVFENAPIDAVVLQGAEDMRAEVTQSRTHTNYPITAVAYPRGRLSLHLSCDRRFFEAETVERLLASFHRLLVALVRHFDQPLRDLPLLDVAERRTLLEGANATERAYPLDRGYPALFEAAVRRHPDRVAAACLGRTVTYDGLNRRAHRLAHALLAAGAQPDATVALLGDRNLDLLAMILGTLKAGAGYLALDPAHPTARLRQVVAAARPRAILCQAVHRAALERVLAEVPEADRPPVLVIEDLAAADLPDCDPGVPLGPRHLAYVIFTSGSTGVPKGVMVEQAGMLNNQLSKVPYLGLSGDDVIAQTANQGFDISVWQFLAGLLCGARVEIVPDAVAHDPQALLAHVAETGVTVLESVPSLIQGMLQGAGLPLPALRWLLPTGEALPPAVARAWCARHPGIPLVNAYGPAECSDDVALHRIDPAPEDRAVLPIGTPTDNNRLYILDERLEPLPVGAVGELYVAGTGVGRGYLGDPARTASSFLPDPFGVEPGGRLYRTGDLARWNAEGVIDYVGRADHQVKIRGFRIELGEIEARLRRHAEVREAVVVVRETPAGKGLVGYVVAAAGEADEALPARLKAHLREGLPDHMVPPQFVRLDRLPLNANGKLDRAALPDPGLGARVRVAPRNELEARLAAIWADLLQVGEVGVTDDFFELGGHSLLITQIFSRVRSELQVPLSLRQVFEAPTIAELAELVESLRRPALTRQTAADLDDLMSRLEAL